MKRKARATSAPRPPSPAARVPGTLGVRAGLSRRGELWRGRDASPHPQLCKSPGIRRLF